MPSRQELTDAILAIRKRNSPPLSTLKKPELAALLAKLQGGAETPKAKDMPAPAAARAKFYQEGLDERKKMDDNNKIAIEVSKKMLNDNREEIDEPDSEWIYDKFGNTFEQFLMEKGFSLEEVIKSMKFIKIRAGKSSDIGIAIDNWLEENDITPEKRIAKDEARRKEKEDYEAEQNRVMRYHHKTKIDRLQSEISRKQQKLKILLEELKVALDDPLAK